MIEPCGGIGKLWFTAAELAELGLPGLSKVKRKVNEFAVERRWMFAVATDGAALARKRGGRGGGLEYHYSLLPPSAVTQLVRRGVIAAALSEIPKSALERPPEQDGSRDRLWCWYDGQSDATKTEARRRLAVLDEVEALVAAAHTRTAAIASVAASAKISAATLWTWDGLAKGARADDRLPKLAPRRKGGGNEVEIDPRAWTFFKSDYLRPEKPTIAGCYGRVVAAAAKNGWGAMPHPKTFQRRLDREVDPRVVIQARHGGDAVRGMLPPQQRTVAGLHALQLVNIDGHKWDVFVRWPDGTIGRPVMVAIQDVYSRKLLAWRIGQTESAVLTRLAFADLFRHWGIPAGCLLDNSRAFASKWITGGAKTRFRFKIRPEDPTGLLPALGVNPHWATPYRGQSKPIERYFQIVCEHGAKHPAFAGAYTGNNPDAKPENYGSKAVELETFKAVAGQVISQVNATLGRRTETARGRSYDIAFEESYRVSAIGRATQEQLRIALLAADQVSTDRKSGAVNFLGNRYWTPELSAVAGEKVVIRFDPDALQTQVHVYAADGRYLAEAPVIAATGFLDVEAAKERAKLEARNRRASRDAYNAEQLLNAAELAALLPDTPDETPASEANVLRPVRFRHTGAAALKAADTAPDFMDRFVAAEGRLRLVE